MTRILHTAAFLAGMAAVVWVGAGYVQGTHPMALALTALIGAFYLLGAFELLRFQQATAGLVAALTTMTAAPPHLGEWLEPLHPSLRNAVRLRVEGERVGLPGPALAPYLAGLLVLLGMLGTFLGMVVTLNGTGLALDGATDVQAVRASLSAPVRGLGLAFGTSVAGVAASAMLGLMSALCRRERLQAAQLLDTRIATGLRVFSRAHQRDESFKLLQLQAGSLPLLVDRLQAMMATVERQSQTLHERLAASQDDFHTRAQAAYSGLAASVDRSLQTSLAASAKAAGAAIQPVVEATMAGIARETAVLHTTLAQTVQQQLAAVAAGFDSTTASVADTWQRAVAQHQQVGAALASDTQQALSAAADGFAQQTAALAQTVDNAHQALQARIDSRETERLAAWTGSLHTVTATLQHGWQQAAVDAAGQQQQVVDTLAQTAQALATHTEAQARATIAEVQQLVQMAGEAPRAAADVLAALRQQLSDSTQRDNTLLEERGRLLQTLAAQVDAVNQASTEQRAAIDALVGASADVLDRVGERFNAQVDAGSGKLVAAAAELTGSAAEVASLGDGFGLAVQLFSQSNDKLLQQLQRIEGALSKTITRSDEQLAYYVAQAREVIDLSITSQKQIVEDLQQLQRTSRREAAGSDA